MKAYGAEMTVGQLAEELGEAPEAIALAIRASMPAMSLTPESDDGDERQLDIPVASPEEELADKISLEEVLESLPASDQALIRLRFYGNRTQSDTAKTASYHPGAGFTPGAKDPSDDAGKTFGGII